ncbi:ATP-binding protein [Actinoallomurus sp. NPDC052308]|uniref:ATP-binding protein n=1 Tax=Actinoallomurus sp. NPDC052308 TaxID=3155530 RepID=UPI0034488B08
MTPDPAVADRPPSRTAAEPGFLPLQARPEVVRQARRFAAEAVSGHPYDPYDVALLASELATNAVRAATALHPWPDDIWPIGVEVTVTDRYVHLAVSDPDPEPLSARQMGGLLAENGRGLVIIDQHALAWWPTYTEHGKTVHVIVPASGVILTAAELAEIREPR